MGADFQLKADRGEQPQSQINPSDTERSESRRRTEGNRECSNDGQENDDFENGHGRVTVGDTQWKASTESDDPKIGDALVITSVTGATLIVEPSLKA